MAKKLFEKDTEESRLKDVNRDYKMIKYMVNPSLNVIKEALRHGSNETLDYIDKQYITSEICDYAIENVRLALKYMPEEFKTLENCKKAVTKYGCNLQYITNKTQELCLIAMKNTYDAFPHIPIELRNEEIYYLAVKGGVSLKDIPRNRISKRMCLTSVKAQSCNIQNVPDRYKTPELYLEVFESNKNIFKYMPKNLMTEDLCVRALESDINFIEFVPKELQTDKICLKILSHRRYYEFLKFITSDSEVIKKKVEKLNNKEKRYKEIFRGCHMGRGFMDWGMPPLEMITEPIMDYVSECEDKIDTLTSEVETIKKELDELKKLIPRPTETHEA